MARAKTSAWPPLLTARALVIEAIEQRLAEAGLPELAWYDVLWTLEQAPSGRLRMHELAAATVITRSNMTRLVDRLEAAGLVTRARDAEDRRGALALLTSAGRDMRARMWKVYGPAIAQLFDAHVSEKESATLRACLLRIIEAARA
ncbi:MAG: MarR family transcriptional regulator [Hyphomonadaceae bacterium]|jgi:DNA-binding MarR family transcriptional regulator|nr:MarR family transcriptional regulator [Hyphomonadaceae bacterium]